MKTSFVRFQAVLSRSLAKILGPTSDRAPGATVALLIITYNYYFGVPQYTLLPITIIFGFLSRVVILVPFWGSL